jgi:hypothetical protein
LVIGIDELLKRKIVRETVLPLVVTTTYIFKECGEDRGDHNSDSSSDKDYGKSCEDAVIGN